MSFISDLITEKTEQCLQHQQDIIAQNEEFDRSCVALFAPVTKLFSEASESGLKTYYRMRGGSVEMAPLQVPLTGDFQCLLTSGRGNIHIRVADTERISNLKKEEKLAKYLPLLEEILEGRDIYDRKLFLVIWVDYQFYRPQFIVDGLYIYPDHEIQKALQYILDLLVQVSLADQHLLTE